MLDELGVERAMVAGYSMGGAVAQLMWRQHPERVAGLVLCSTARNYRGASRERLFFPVLTAAMHPLSGSRLDPRRADGRDAAGAPVRRQLATRPPGARRSSGAPAPGRCPEVLGDLGRFNSASWIGGVDVPTSVVVTASRPHLPGRRRAPCRAIDDAVAHDAPGGHASIVLDHARWTPVFLEAVADVTGRVPARRLAV